MKRILSSLVMAIAVLSFVGLSWAATVSGTLEKIDDKTHHYVVKDDKGKSHKIHYDDTTQKTGDLKAGAKVEVDVKKNHANSIKVVEEKK
jgi:hypothetical protein